MLTNQATPDPTGVTKGNGIGRRCVAGAVLLSLATASLLATSGPAVAVEQNSPSVTATDAGIGVEPVRVQAESYNSDNGNGLKKENSTDATGGSLGNVGGTWNGGQIVFDAVELGSAPLGTLTVRYVNNSGRVGANPSLDFYVGDVSAESKLTNVPLPVTGSNWNAYNTTTVELPEEISGTQKLIVVMNVEAYADHPYVGNFDYFEFGPAQLPETYLDTDDAWKYSDDGSDPSGDGSLSWTTADFDDTAWKSAVGSFGSKKGAADLGGGFVADTLVQYAKTGSSDTIETYHFRNEIDLTAGQLAQLEGLAGEIVYDDAVRIYANGTLVTGFEDQRVATAANQNLTYAGNSNGNPLTSEFEIPADLLVAGENTISVALYQDRASSSDIYLDVTSIAPLLPPEEPEGPQTAKITDVVLGVGEDETSRNLAWYSDIDVAQTAQLAKTADLVDGAFPADARVVEPTKTGGTSSGEYFRDVTFGDLAENTSYSYRVGNDAEGWSDTSEFRTQSFDGDFSFLFFGDPQIGASGNRANDEAGWIDTLNVATESYPDAEILFSAGDQVESAPNEAEYQSLFTPEQMQSIPFVATNGNHDVGSKAYEQHFNLPNEDLTAGAGSGSSSGGDYWFLYKDVLFVNINSNSRDYASHNAFMEKVIAEQGDKAKWKVLAFHHSIYSVASHYADGDIIDRRATMPETISALDFDAVLMGHDHNYTRSYLIEDGELADSKELAGQSKVEAKDGEVLYVTANSSSGSKYYNTTAPDAWFASVINQERVRNYSVVEVTDGELTFRTLRSQANGSASPVNSVVDEVVLTKDAAPALTVPADSEITVGDEFDALAGVSATDNVDGDLTADVEVTGTVDTAKEGVYTLDYSVADRRGNVTNAERVITVVAETEEPGTEEPGTEEPGTEEPGTEEPGTEQPTFTPAPPASDGDALDAALEDKVTVSISGQTAKIAGLTPGEWHYVYAYSTPTALGWVRADALGTATVTLPSGLAAGAHRIAVTDATGALMGWTGFTLSATGADGAGSGSGSAATGTAPAGGLAATGSDAATAWGVGSVGALLLAAGGALLIARRRASSR